jgi:serine/threonine protein kinase
MTHFDDSHIELDAKDFKIKKKLGNGAYASVYLAEWTRDVTEAEAIAEGISSKGSSAAVASEGYGTRVANVALKVVEDSKQDDLQKYVRSELSIIRSISSPFIVEYVGAFMKNKQLYVAMECCGGGNLEELIEVHSPWYVSGTGTDGVGGGADGVGGTDDRAGTEQEGKALSWAHRARLCMQAAQGLVALHSRDLIHRDVKAENLLLDEAIEDAIPGIDWSGRPSDALVATAVAMSGGGDVATEDGREYSFKLPCVKICDLGFARYAHTSSRLQSICGTDATMAPEVILGMDYSCPADVFSMGIVFAQLVTLTKAEEREPRDAFGFDEDSFRTLVTQQNEVATAAGSVPCPQSYVELVCQCCSYEPEDRPLASDAVDWLAELAEELDSRD